MKTLSMTALLLLASLPGAGGAAWAAPLLPPAPIDAPGTVQVSANCYGAGERAARNAGGTMVGVRAAMQNGRPVCIVVVSVPAPDGKRPRLQEIVVPQ